MINIKCVRERDAGRDRSSQCTPSGDPTDNQCECDVLKGPEVKVEASDKPARGRSRDRQVRDDVATTNKRVGSQNPLFQVIICIRSYPYRGSIYLYST